MQQIQGKTSLSVVPEFIGGSNLKHWVFEKLYLIRFRYLMYFLQFQCMIINVIGI
jgi:hypothetical protein